MPKEKKTKIVGELKEINTKLTDLQTSWNDCLEH